MPPAFVRTIREEIFYEYAKLISRSAYKSLQRGFITDRFKKLRDGEITISGTMREWEREQELPKTCVYCDSTTDLTTDHLIPRSKEKGDGSIFFESQFVNFKDATPIFDPERMSISNSDPGASVCYLLIYLIKPCLGEVVNLL